VQLTVTLPSTRSEAVGATYDTVAEPVDVDPVVPVAAEVKEGGVVSTTITLKESTTIEGSLSSVHVTSVEPSGKSEFGAWSQVAPEGAVKSTFAPPGPVASCVMSLLSQCMADAEGVSVSARKRMKTSRRTLTPLIHKKVTQPQSPCPVRR
jgi:hypothetical protein